MFRLLSPLYPALFALPPEQAHALTLHALRLAGCERDISDDPRLQASLLGLNFRNPVGMAAGFDKNAEVVDKLLALGFGFVEAGGVTLRPQAGNPGPRVFRLVRDGALINRLGFNNQGIAAMRPRLEKLKTCSGVFGVNLGVNKDSSDRIQDYLALIGALSGLVDFVTLNVSSPNTPGLRDLQSKEALKALLLSVMEKRGAVTARKTARLPVLLKIAPDLTRQDLDEIARLSLQCEVDGLVISNTTVSRPNLHDKNAKETGGLSGRPLFALSTRRLAQLRLRVGQNMVLIGVGGIDSGEAAWAKIRAGANLLQLYTGLVYRGPALVDEIKQTLLARLNENGMESLQQAVGGEAEDYSVEEA